MKIKIWMPLAVLLLLRCSSNNVSEDEQAIRNARAEHNKAILNHDTVAIDGIWMDNFVVISSRDYQVNGKEANRSLFINEFASKPDVLYVRTPESVTLMPAWNMASEYGRWEGGWSDGGNKIRLRGDYYAKWHKVNGRWLLRVEVFTPKECIGGTYCENQPIN